MIKLFRNIRKNLLNNGQTTKYFEYTIGEILLVVFGILIALQVNNWNESRKDNAEEIKILFYIRKALESDLENQFAFHFENVRMSV